MIALYITLAAIAVTLPLRTSGGLMLLCALFGHRGGGYPLARAGRRVVECHRCMRFVVQPAIEPPRMRRLTQEAIDGGRTATARLHDSAETVAVALERQEEVERQKTGDYPRLLEVARIEPVERSKRRNAIARGAAWRYEFPSGRAGLPAHPNAARFPGMHGDAGRSGGPINGGAA